MQLSSNLVVNYNYKPWVVPRIPWYHLVAVPSEDTLLHQSHDIMNIFVEILRSSYITL